MGTGQWLKMQVTAGAERELQSMWCGWHLFASLDCKKRRINKHSALLTSHFAIYIFSHNLVHKKLPQTSSRATRCVSSKNISLWRLSGHQRTLEAIRLAEICFQPPLCPFDIITLHQPADWPHPSFCFFFLCFPSPSVFTCRCMSFKTMEAGSWSFSTGCKWVLMTAVNHTNASSRGVSTHVYQSPPPLLSSSAALPLIQPLSPAVCLRCLGPPLLLGR